MKPELQQAFDYLESVGVDVLRWLRENDHGGSGHARCLEQALHEVIVEKAKAEEEAKAVWARVPDTYDVEQEIYKGSELVTVKHTFDVQLFAYVAAIIFGIDETSLDCIAKIYREKGNDALRYFLKEILGDNPKEKQKPAKELAALIIACTFNEAAGGAVKTEVTPVQKVPQA